MTKEWRLIWYNGIWYHSKWENEAGEWRGGKELIPIEETIPGVFPVSPITVRETIPNVRKTIPNVRETIPNISNVGKAVKKAIKKKLRFIEVYRKKGKRGNRMR